MYDVWAFAVLTIPTMMVLGMRHGLDVDHITAIDNLVRLHNAVKRSRWVGAGFSLGHMLSVLAEMMFIICVVGSITNAQSINLWGGIIGAVTLGAIGATNIYSMKKWGKSGSAILASKILARSGLLGTFGSTLVTGIVFGLGFDTATQISAISLSAAASATVGVQVSLVLAGFFAMGMIPLDTLDSVLLRSAFSRMFNTRGFHCMSYSLSTVAMSIAVISSYGIVVGRDILPDWADPSLAGGVIAISFGYSFLTRKKRVRSTASNTVHEHHSTTTTVQAPKEKVDLKKKAKDK